MGLISRVSSRTYRRKAPPPATMDAEALLAKLKQASGPLSTYDLSQNGKIDHQSIVGSMNSLISKGGEKFLKSESSTIINYDLSAEAQDVMKNGSYEFRLLAAVPDGGISQPELMKVLGKNGKIGFAKAMQKKWVALDKPSKQVTK